MTSRIDSLSKPSTNPDSRFDVQSVGYQAIQAAASNQLDALKKCLQQDRASLTSLHLVTAEGDKYTPLHYALTKKQFAAAAYLLNQNADWFTPPQRSDGKPGSKPIDLLNKIEKGLCLLLKSFVDSEESINLSALVTLLTSPLLSTERRREVLHDKSLRVNLCKKLSTPDSLFIMACFLIGSNKWKGMQTDFPDYLNLNQSSDVLEANKTMCCNHLLMYASILAGFVARDQAGAYYFRNIPTPSADAARILRDPYSTQQERDTAMFPVNQMLSKNLGLVRRGPNNLLDLSKPYQGTRIVYMEGADNGLIEHYGILHCNDRGNFLIHITQRTGCIVVEKAEDALKIESLLTSIKAIYTGVLNA